MWYGSGLLFHGAAFCCVDTWRHPWAAEFRGLSQRLRLELQRELCVDEELSWVMKVKLIHRHRNLGWTRWSALWAKWSFGLPICRPGSGLSTPPCRT